MPVTRAGDQAPSSLLHPLPSTAVPGCRAALGLTRALVAPALLSPNKPVISGGLSLMDLGSCP